MSSPCENKTRDAKQNEGIVGRSRNGTGKNRTRRPPTTHHHRCLHDNIITERRCHFVSSLARSAGIRVENLFLKIILIFLRNITILLVGGPRPNITYIRFTNQIVRVNRYNEIVSCPRRVWITRPTHGGPATRGNDFPYRSVDVIRSFLATSQIGYRSVLLCCVRNTPRLVLEHATETEYVFKKWFAQKP